MTQQITSHALETSFSPVEKVLEKPIKLALKSGYDFPKEFLSELCAFLERNRIVHGPKLLKNTHCLQCFKAHALNMARKHGIKDNIVTEIEKTMSGKTGHEGYYLDGNDLITL